MGRRLQGRLCSHYGKGFYFHLPSRGRRAETADRERGRRGPGSPRRARPRPARGRGAAPRAGEAGARQGARRIRSARRSPLPPAERPAPAQPAPAPSPTGSPGLRVCVGGSGSSFLGHSPATIAPLPRLRPQPFPGNLGAAPRTARTRHPSKANPLLPQLRPSQCGHWGRVATGVRRGREEVGCEPGP